MALRRAWSLFAWCITPQSGWIPYDSEPKLVCVVQVRRRSDGMVAVDYDYKLESEALAHARSLRERLDDMTIADFDRELGIGLAR